MTNHWKHVSPQKKYALSNSEKTWILRMGIASIIGMGFGISLMVFVPTILNAFSPEADLIPNNTWHTLLSIWPYLVPGTFVTFVIALIYGTKHSKTYLDRKREYQMVSFNLSFDDKRKKVRNDKASENKNRFLLKLNPIRIGILQRQPKNYKSSSKSQSHNSLAPEI